MAAPKEKRKKEEEEKKKKTDKQNIKNWSIKKKQISGASKDLKCVVLYAPVDMGNIHFFILRVYPLFSCSVKSE